VAPCLVGWSHATRTSVRRKRVALAGTVNWRPAAALGISLGPPRNSKSAGGVEGLVRASRGPLVPFGQTRSLGGDWTQRGLITNARLASTGEGRVSQRSSTLSRTPVAVLGSLGYRGFLRFPTPHSLPAASTGESRLVQRERLICSWMAALTRCIWRSPSRAPPPCAPA
jgi:hypothetical protein